MSTGDEASIVNKFIIKLINITPQIITDLGTCDDLTTGNAAIVLEWVKANINPITLVENLTANVYDNWWRMSTLSMKVSYDWVAGTYYDVGKDVGEIVQSVMGINDPKLKK